MIQLPRSLVRRFVTVLRRSQGEQALPGDWPVVLCHADSRGLSLRGARDDVVVSYDRPGPHVEDTLAFRASVLKQFEGRTDDPVTLESAGAGKARACWTEGEVPRAVDFETVKPETLQPLPPFPKRWSPLPPDFAEALEEAARTTSTSSTRFTMCRVQLRGQSGEVVATDGRQLLVRRGYVFPWTDDVLVPRLLLATLADPATDGAIQIGRTRRHVGVRLGHWTWLLAMDMNGRFPDVRTVIPQARAVTSTIHFGDADAALLLKVLAGLAGPKDDCSVTVDANGPVVVRVSAGKSDITELELPTARSEGHPVLLCCDRRYLQRALKLGFRRLDIIQADSPVIWPDETRLYVFMPLDAQSALPATPNAVRVAPKTPQPEVPPSPPQRRKIPMPPAPTNGQHRPDKDADPRQRTNDSVGLEELISEAETVRAMLHESQSRLARLVTALKQQRRQSKAVQQAMQSLRHLQLSP